MTEKVKVGYVIDHESADRLRAMADHDRRTLSGMLEWLIDREWERHQQPRTLIDTSESYSIECVPEQA